MAVLNSSKKFRSCCSHISFCKRHLRVFLRGFASARKTAVEIAMPVKNKKADSGRNDAERRSHDIPPDRICWLFTLNVLIHHVLAIYGCKLLLQGKVLWSTLVFAWILGYAALLGTTIGAHRLWSHRSFKAKWPLRLLLAILQVLAYQSSIWQWVAWHRAHHKHSDKELDPHNAAKGFFYAHIGWVFTYDPKRFRIQMETINMEDVEADPIAMWQERNYDLLFFIMNLLVAVGIPWYYFGEEFWTAFSVCFGVRITVVQNIIFLINSAAHLYGSKPYDKNMYPVDNKLVSYLSLGEGWHNYHHTFTWDYRASEFGGFYRYNPSAAVIDFFAKIGWAYDLKTASPQLVAARIKRTGMALAD